MSAPQFKTGDVVIRHADARNIRLVILSFCSGRSGSEPVYKARLESKPGDQDGYLLWESDISHVAGVQ